MANPRQKRETLSREAFTRPTHWSPAALLPEINQEPGWAYRWIRTSMVGQSDPTNVSAKMREGWEPVKLSEHPELQLFATGDSRFEDSVEVGGLMLCKCPEEFIDQRRAYYNQQTQSQTEAVDNSFMKENDPRMPLFSQKQSKTSFGRGK